MYIKNGDKFDTYYNSGDGFEKVNLVAPLTEDEVIDNLFFIDMMWQYGDLSSDMKKDGSETIAGRSCDKFSYQYVGIGAALKYVVCIDKQTDVCLKWTYDIASAGGSGGFSFECTEFKTSGVTLPSYN